MKIISAQFGLFARRLGAVAALVTAIGICGGLGGGVQAGENQTGPLILEMKIDGEIGPVLVTYAEEGLAEAARRHASLVMITMDTPGGLSDSTEKIVRHILDSSVPVAVYIAPKGARGASAGFFILLSADIAAMAPATRTGAASGSARR